MMQKSSLSNFCLTNVRNLKVFLEIHGRDIAFSKSEQSYYLTSMDAEAAVVRLLLPLYRKRHIFLEIHGRDIAFSKSEQSYYLTSMDAEAAVVRLLLPLYRKRHIPESYSIVMYAYM